MIYFYCLACFIPSIIMLFAMFYNEDFDVLGIWLSIFLFVFGFYVSLMIYSSYFPPASLETLEKIEKIITNKTMNKI